MMDPVQLMFDIFRSEDKLLWEIDCFKGYREGLRVVTLVFSTDIQWRSFQWRTEISDSDLE